VQGSECPRVGRRPAHERKDHLAALAKRCSRFARNVLVLKGGMTARERQHAMAALAAIANREERIILATGRYLGEGFDDARLDTLFLTMPIAWRGTPAQYAGRLDSLHHRKRAGGRHLRLCRSAGAGAGQDGGQASGGLSGPGYEIL